MTTAARNVPGASPAASAPWRQALPALSAVLTGLLLLYRDTFWGMLQIWLRSDTFAHGMFVVPISLWLIWRQRERLRALTPSPSPWVLLPMLALALLWLLGELVAVNAVTQLAATALLVLAVFLLLGSQVGGNMLFPLGFVFFAVPIGEFMMPLMMVWTADFTVLALRLTDIPVYREGLQFIIPSGSWSVVEACSGVRYLIASLVVGTLFAYLNYRSLWRRWVFVGVSILVPILANWLRAYMIVMLGHVSGNTLATGADHLVYGWVFFGVVMLLMFMIGARWSEPDAEVDQPAQPRTVGLPGVAVSSARGWTPWRTAFACLVLMLLPQAVLWQLAHPDSAAAVRLPQPLRFASNWTNVSVRQAGVTARFTPSFQNPSATTQAWTQNAEGDAAVVGVYLAYYRHQSAQRKLVSSQNMLVPSGDGLWSVFSDGTQPVALPAGNQPVRTVVLRPANLASAAGDDQLLVWQLYWIDGVLTASDLQAKLIGAGKRLMGRGDDSAVMIFSTPRGMGGQGEARLQAFLANNLQVLDAQLNAVRQAASAAP